MPCEASLPHRILSLLDRITHSRQSQFHNLAQSTYCNILPTHVSSLPALCVGANPSLWTLTIVAALQVYADPDNSLLLLVGWDSPTETNGAEILSYVIELAPSSLGSSEPYMNVTIEVDDAAETATSANVGGASRGLGNRKSFPLIFTQQA